MPTKFVQNSAARAGVSVEKAERVWHDAKAAVHKGKRRGSWYWGKVVNTFKRMMGLTESITFSEFTQLMEEVSQKHEKDRFPDGFKLEGRLFAERDEDHTPFGVTYQVVRLMDDDSEKFRCGARWGKDADKVTWFFRMEDLSKTPNFGHSSDQPDGVDGFDADAFIEWARRQCRQAIRTGFLKEDAKGKHGEYANDSAEKGMVNKIIDLNCNAGNMKGGKIDTNFDLAYDFLESDWGGRLWDKYYELFTSMHPGFEGPVDRHQYGDFKREAVAWYKNWKNGAKLPAEVKPLPKHHD